MRFWFWLCSFCVLCDRTGCSDCSEEEAVPAPADASNNANKSGVEEKVIA
jgi:hypothetical protein